MVFRVAHYRTLTIIEEMNLLQGAMTNAGASTYRREILSRLETTATDCLDRRLDPIYHDRGCLVLRTVALR